ncbi:SET domain-containing histone-lysine N-methyltransferase [Acanthopleuribacter pedis]|uniref:SET domain-containing protein-lysine N-methyltransferase n=1 Tax=Acanthopleuribacter pedis TaxID=442870 RepID=A0A8J7U335_9BACT|nr:SET domain-containing histone-lysine N-methyltransferase [Acanthopleuribacter pedis]MBO1319217.1 SET domain-containing protein-lysine N-methyltransferase [Acanthopleuribacter pedis]
MDCKAKGVPDDAWSTYFVWLTEHGCRFPHIQIATMKDGERALVAMKSFDGKDEILTVPRSLMITPKTVHDSELGALIAEREVELHSAQTLLALFVLNESGREDSFWQPFLKRLPTNYEHVPAYFDQNLLDELVGSFTHKPILHRQKILRREYATIREKLGDVYDWSFEQVRWAMTVVNTRCFSLPNAEGKDEPVVVPLADMINHGEPANAKWRAKEPGGDLEIRARGPLAAGRQIKISYGHKTKGRFFASYGFFDLNNDRWQAAISIAATKDDPCEAKKNAFLKRQQGPFFSLHFRRYEKLGRALKAQRCLLIDWNNTLEQRLVKAGKIVSQENERQVMLMTAKRCRDALAEFPHDLESDRRLLLDETRMAALEPHVHSIVQLRCSEKQVLHRVAAFAESIADLLEGSAEEVLEVLVKPDSVEAWPPALRRWFQSWSEDMVPVLFTESGARRMEAMDTRPMLGED